MQREHAINYLEPLSVAQVEYLCMKANKLGRMGKNLSKVYQEEDSEGKHVYFEIFTEIYGQTPAV